MIPSDITFDANATPPQWTDNGEQVIEKGTNIRIKIKGLRSEVDKMFAVGTMKEVSRNRSNFMHVHCLLYSRTTLGRCQCSHLHLGGLATPVR
jgi:DNA-directed RNA polymerase subunit E'/Rpb7